MICVFRKFLDILHSPANKLFATHKGKGQSSQTVSSHTLLPPTIAAMLGWVLKDPSISCYSLSDWHMKSVGPASPTYSNQKINQGHPAMGGWLRAGHPEASAHWHHRVRAVYSEWLTRPYLTRLFIFTYCSRPSDSVEIAYAFWEN